MDSTTVEEIMEEFFNTSDAEEYEMIESDDQSDLESVASSVDLLEEMIVVPVLDSELSDANNLPDEVLHPEVTPQKRKRPLPEVFSSPATIPVVKWRGKRSSLNRSFPDFNLNTLEDKWKSVDEPDPEPQQPVFRPIQTPGPQVVCSASCRPLQYFELFFTSSIIQTIVDNSNAYAAKMYGSDKSMCRDISVKDFKKFLAMVIYMGLVKCCSLTDYWKTSDLYRLPFPGRIMSFKKFYAICNCFHISDPKVDEENDQKKGTDEYDRLCRIKPLYEDIREACKSSFQPFQNISIDERMVASKARNGLKQYMKNKPTKWGYKLYVLADSSSGYTWDFFVYEGRSILKQGKGIGYESVMALADEKLLGSGYKLYVDNFFTSPALFRDLLSKNIYACGTLRANRIGHTQTPGPPGSIRWFRDDKLLFIEWKDRRDVLMCSTFHKVFNGDTVKRRVKGKNGARTIEDLPVPAAVLDYNKHMGGVDLSDALIGYYTVLHKTKKWYRSFFYHFVDIAVVNALIIHQHVARERNQKPMTQKQFREALISDLAQTGPKYHTARVGSDEFHLPKYISGDATEGRRKCRVCRAKTPIMCVMCEMPLCLVAARNCFIEFHESEEAETKVKAKYKRRVKKEKRK
ncbi:piggyBac transposable element-derived protein 4 [Misgurnus anguillicaudatus]|uniref:piggyBac transposable element-derived protein 4 n=1 Tax=Misgurnus anguillicaudatus TaxID=75329 RepID=UPI003CCF1DF9